jgi:hypothetical protein
MDFDLIPDLSENPIDPVLQVDSDFLKQLVVWGEE